MKILLIEDNDTISEALSYSFKETNFNLNCVSSLKEALFFLRDNDITIVILDLMLPDGNGLDFYKEYLKDEMSTIILTAIDDEDVVVDALNTGVDDYMIKPFSTKELLARVNRICLKQMKKNIITIDKVKYDIDKMELFVSNKKVELTNLETRIINLLFMNIDKVVTRDTLLDSIWEWTGNDVDSHTVTVYLKRIREKMGIDIIKTVKGIGYRIDRCEK